MTKLQSDAVYVQEVVRHISQRQMVHPLLLFVAGHRPLAFVVGQALHMAAPIALLLGQEKLADWATLLSDPEGAALLESSLQAEQGD